MSKENYTFDPDFKQVIARMLSSENSYSANSTIDNLSNRPNHGAMTDLTRQEVDAKLAQNKAEVDARLANFDTSIKTGFAELRTEFAKQSGDMRTELANVRAEMHKNTIDVIKWVIITVLGVATATVSILTFVINNAVPKAPTQPAAPPVAQQQSPLVVAVPAGSTLLNAPTQAPQVAQPAAK